MDEYLRPSAKGISQIGAYFEDKSGKGFSFYVYVTFFKEREPLAWISKKKYKRYSRKAEIADSSLIYPEIDNSDGVMIFNHKTLLHIGFMVDHTVGEELYPNLDFRFSENFRRASFEPEEPVRDEGLAASLWPMRRGVVFRDGVKANPVKFSGKMFDLSEPEPAPQDPPFVYVPDPNAGTSSTSSDDEDVPF